MKDNQSQDDRPLHQTVAEGFEFKVGAKSIAVEFTEQKLSAHAGSATFWAWLHSTRWATVQQLPQRAPTSNNHLTPLEKALAFSHGLLCEARKLTAYFRRDPAVPEMLGIRRVASASVLSRFFSGFASAGKNLTCFRPLWRWCVDRLPSRPGGYTLDLDSTRLLHEDGHQEGVRAGYTRVGVKPCLHPLLAVIGEVRLRGVCANSGFCLPELLDFWEQLRLPYVVVAQLSEPIKNVLRGGLVWTATEVRGTDVAELAYQTLSWSQLRRLILIRHRVAERPEAGGKKLIDVPGYVFQALVTSRPASEPPLAVWRYYNGRADCENIIKELQQGFALTILCLQSFWATEAALCLATLTYNLTALFQRHLGWQQKVTIHSLRFWLFITPGISAHSAEKNTIKLAVPPRERDWWSRLWEKISPFPNCNAAENRPAFAI
jgi:Transposase DDE domain group 1